jgi:hypothetical protein
MAIRLPTQHKYGAKKTTIDGITFDSKAEAQHYSRLKLLQRAGEIKEIQIQPRYNLLEAYKHPETGKKVQGIDYVADFLVTYSDGRTEVVDVKGVKTEAYKIKKKLFESKYGKAIREVS